jgi:hypothetical protein
MPSNNTGFEAGVIFGQHPTRMAHLHSADKITEPKANFPWSLDNGVFGAFTRGVDWSEEPFYHFLDRYASHKPTWVVVPDSVGNAEKTLHMWGIHNKAVRGFGVPTAFAAQDGMAPSDCPPEADMIFLGGSTSWKWQNLPAFAKFHGKQRIHVGRVNTYRLLWMAHPHAASCDGTGWFRGCRKQLQGLRNYLNESSQSNIRDQKELCLTP